ncbi:MAG: hypothetical protein ACJAV1_003121, partial [Paraglaciecola sp.]
SDEEHCPRAAFFAYFFWLQQKSKLNEGIRLKKAWMPCAQRINGEAIKKRAKARFHQIPKKV